MRSVDQAVVLWSSGKDSAWALHCIQRAGSYEIVGLLTTLTAPFRRVSMHGVREQILDSQARALALPCHKAWLPCAPCPNNVYEKQMAEVLVALREQGVSHIICGDIFLEDIRAYRQRQMEDLGLEPVFPLWRKNTAMLARDMIAGGLEAVVVCIDPGRLARRFAGALFNEDFLAALPEDVDPCGENGEFHTVVSDGPFFAQGINFAQGETVLRDGFLFSDFRIRRESD